MIFAEPLYSLEDYRAFTRAVPIPVLANITEFGKTPPFTVGELRGVGVVLYSLSAFRAMSAAAVRVRETIWKTRTQKGVVDQMQTREQLNDHCFEDKLDQLFTKNQKV